MKNFPSHTHLLNQKGLTLVELMIVIAIIGILSSIAVVAFNRQVERAKVTKLEQYAMDLSRGQQEFYSRHNSYFPIDNAQAPTFTGAAPANSPGPRFTVKQVMGFDHSDLPQDVTIRMSAGSAGENCAGAVCPATVQVDNTTSWYVIAVEQDLDPSEANNTTIFITSSMEKPVVLFEGQ